MAVFLGGNKQLKTICGPGEVTRQRCLHGVNAMRETPALPSQYLLGHHRNRAVFANYAGTTASIHCTSGQFQQLFSDGPWAGRIKALASDMGLIPREYSSGEQQRLGSSGAA